MDRNSYVLVNFNYNNKRSVLWSFLLESFSDPKIEDSLPDELETKKVELADSLHRLPEDEIDKIYNLYLKNIPKKKKHILNYLNQNNQKPEYTTFDFELITKNLKKFCFLRSQSLNKYILKSSLPSKEKTQSQKVWNYTKKIMQKAAVFCLTAGISVSIYGNIIKDIDHIKYLNRERITQRLPQPVIPSNIIFKDTSGIKCISKKVDSPIKKIHAPEFDIDTIKTLLKIVNDHAKTGISGLNKYFYNISRLINFNLINNESENSLVKYNSPDLPKISSISKGFINRSLSKISRLREKKIQEFEIRNFSSNRSLDSIHDHTIELLKSGFNTKSSTQVYIGFWKNSRSRFRKHTATHVGYLILNNNSIDVLHARGRKIMIENISTLDTYKLKTVICLNVTKMQHRKFKKLVKKYSKRIKYYQRDRCARFVWMKARECGFQVPQNDAWNQRKWYLKSVNTDSNGQKSPKYEIIYDFRITKNMLKKSGPLFSYITPVDNKVCLN